MKNHQSLRQKYWFCLLVNMVVCGLFVAIMFPFFEANDDQVIMHLVDGTMGYTDPHLVYQNALLGVILMGLYSVCRFVPWYTLLQYTAICLGFAGVTWVLQKRSEKPARAWVVNVLLWLYFGYDCYTKIQFTKTAAIAGVSGVFVLYDALLPAGTDAWRLYKEGIVLSAVRNGSSRYEETPKAGTVLPKISRLQVAGGLAIAFFGSLYRARQFLPCAVITSGIGISLLFALKPYAKQVRIRLLGRYAAVMGLMFALTIGAFVGDQIYYQMDEEWSYYREYTMLRARLLDYGMPDYDANIDVFNEVGIDRAAYDLLCKWTLADPEVYNIEALRKLAALRPKAELLSKEKFQSFWGDAAAKWHVIRTFFAFVSVFLIWLLSRRHRAADLIGAGWSIVVFLACYYYLYANGRYLLNRVDIGLWYALSLVFVWFIVIQPAGRLAWLKSLLIGTVMFAVMVVDQGDSFKPTYRWTKEAANKQRARTVSQIRMEKVNGDKEHLYLAMMGSISDASCSGPFNALPEGYFSNVIWSGGWETYTARFNHALAEYNITNPFRALLETDRVYLVTYENRLEPVIEYMQRYGKHVQAVKVKSVKKKKGLHVYRFVAE